MPNKDEILANLRADLHDTADGVNNLRIAVDTLLQKVKSIDPDTQSTADFMKNPQSIADHRNRLLVSANHLTSLEERLRSLAEALTKKPR